MPRKGENIYKRKDGRWEGRYIKSRSCTGKIIYGYVYAKTYRETKVKLREVIPLHNSKSTAPSVANTNSFSAVASDWLEGVKTQSKESTQNKYENLLNNYILPTYGDQTLDNITYDFIESHCNDLLSVGKGGHGLSPKTVTDVLSVVRNVLKFAIRKGMYVPCDGSDIQVKCTTKPMRVLSKTEQARLCKFLLVNPEPCDIGILVCLFTGLRVGEICALRWEDVSFSDQTLHVHYTLQRLQNKSDNGAPKTKVVVTAPKSSCSIRTIPMPDELSKLLKEHQKSSVGYLLTNDENKYVEPRTMQNRFKKVLELSGVESANFHSLRHTFATRCIELGFDLKSLSEILGHATVNITMNRYVHPTLELKKENMKKLSSLLAVE